MVGRRRACPHYHRESPQNRWGQNRKVEQGLGQNHGGGNDHHGIADHIRRAFESSSIQTNDQADQCEGAHGDQRKAQPSRFDDSMRQHLLSKQMDRLLNNRVDILLSGHQPEPLSYDD